MEKIEMGFRKVQGVCCFTSLAATFSFLLLFVLAKLFPHADGILGDIFFYIFVTILGIGVVSALIACPLKWIAMLIAFVTFGVGIGLWFLLIGALFGAIIAVAIFGFLLCCIPAAITIPHYFKEIQPTLI